MASEEGLEIAMASEEGQEIEMASEEGKVINCDTVDLWNELLQKGNESKKMVVVHFTTGHLGTYIQVGSLLDPIAKKVPKNIYVKIIVNDLKSVAEEFAVEATPTFVFIKEGEIVDRVVGGDPLKVGRVVVKHSLPFKVGSYEVDHPFTITRRPA